MIDLKCKKCGNEKYFYTKEKILNDVCFIFDNKGEYAPFNIDVHDNHKYKLVSVYYYCCECDEKVQKIPKNKRH